MAETGRQVRTLAAFAAVTAAPDEVAEGRLAIPARAFATVKVREVTGRAG